jgi:hypothetical protein
MTSFTKKREQSVSKLERKLIIYIKKFEDIVFILVSPLEQKKKKKKRKIQEKREKVMKFPKLQTKVKK